jgi:hypothetical protein
LERQKKISHNQISEREQILFDECLKIVNKLAENNIVTEIEVIREDDNDKDFSLLAKSIKESIEKSEPEVALDRLHTYLMKFIRKLCGNHEIEITKEESLNAIFGKYLKFIVVNGKVESEMSQKILKYSINIIEAFNDVRNNRSLAHDNQILNYSESVLIFNNVTNSIKFIESIENKIKVKNVVVEVENSDWENLPF